MSEPALSPDEIRGWMQDASQWPNDSYDVATLEPSPTQLRRETALREILPGWCWTGAPGAAILSIGTGKGYWERKYWGSYARIYIIDPSEKTRASLRYFPIPNAQYLGASLFDQDIRQRPVARYAWLGASIHYLFAEFFGWEFMYKLAMMVSDEIVVDAGVFDPETRDGKTFLESWTGHEAFELYRRAQFSYDAFRRRIEGLWEVSEEWPTPWIQGRRTMVLKRVLPPVIAKSELTQLEPVKRTPYWSVYRTNLGFFKETGELTQLLAYDTVSKVMGWSQLLRGRVFDGDRYCGFLTQDLGETAPMLPSVSERMYLSLVSWLFPLGLLPADVARQNIRLHDGRPVWMDIDLRALRQVDARQAAWITTNTYKQYDQAPPDVRGISRYIGKNAESLVRPQWKPPPETPSDRSWQELLRRIREHVLRTTPEGAVVLVVSRGDEELLQFDDRRAWHFPRTTRGGYAGHHPADADEAVALLEDQRARGATHLLLPSSAYWWLSEYPGFRAHLSSRYQALVDDETCVLYALSAPTAPTNLP